LADRAQPQARREDRRRADRAARAVRRRAGRDPREREAEDPQGRPDEGGRLARALGTRSRFAIAYLLLAAAVGTALGAFVVLVQRPGPKPAPPWSSWRPGSSSLSANVLEIADHVGSG